MLGLGFWYHNSGYDFSVMILGPAVNPSIEKGQGLEGGRPGKVQGLRGLREDPTPYLVRLQYSIQPWAGSGGGEGQCYRWEDGLGSTGWGWHLVFFQELELDGHISPQLFVFVPMGLESGLGTLKSTTRPCIPRA